MGQIPVPMIWGPSEPKFPPPKTFSYIQVIKGQFINLYLILILSKKLKLVF